MPGPAVLRSQPPLAALLRTRLPDRGVLDVAAGWVAEPGAALFLVEEGLILVSRAETAIDVRGAGETFGDAVLGGRQADRECARALTAGRVRQWSGEEAAALVARDGEVALAAVRMLVRRAAEWRERMAACGAEPVPRRLARTLLYLKAKAGPRLPGLNLAAVGALAGAPREVAGVHLESFARQGLVTATAAGLIVYPALETWLRDS